jgi:hypothetical protein
MTYGTEDMTVAPCLHQYLEEVDDWRMWSSGEKEEKIICLGN